MPRKTRLDHVKSFETGDHAADMRKLAKESIRVFFKEKSSFYGGKVPRKELYSDHSIKTLMRNRLDERCLNFIHEHCLPLIPFDDNYDDTSIPWSVHCLIKLLKDMGSRQLPKDYFAGLLLLYFKFCYGVKILDPPEL